MGLHDVSQATSSPPPGYEWGYDQITGNVTITSTTEATPTAVISCAAHFFDGSPVLLQVALMALYISPNAGGDYVQLTLFESTTEITQLCTLTAVAVQAQQVPVTVTVRFTPTAGLHTYTIGGHKSASGSTVLAIAGTGSGANSKIGFARFTKV